MNQQTKIPEKSWHSGRMLDLPKLRVSNAIMHDAAALAEAWERDGYWYFESVLDESAIRELRQAYIDELVGMSVIDAGDPDFRYNGGPLDTLPKNPVAGTIQGMFARAPWKKFVETPKIHDVFRGILQAEPAWMPILGYRVGKPGHDPAAERFEFVHQDGFFNPGIPFMNCWIPLVEIDQDIGGIVVAEGWHKHPDVHLKGEPPHYLIPPGEIPHSAWRRADYKPGDLLVLSLDVPHSGVTNVSQDRFRMSLDLRMLPASGPLPVIGTLEEIAADRIVIRSEGGNDVVLTVDDETYCRGNTTVNGSRIAREELSKNYELGNSVIVAHERGRATVVRPAAY